MSVYQLLPIILFSEAIIILCLLIFIISKKIRFLIKDRDFFENKKEINKIIKTCLEDGKHVSKFNLKKFAFSNVLLLEMEAFEYRLQEIEWEKLKEEISAEFLLPRARNWTKSRFWTRRNYAARCFALSPQFIDEKMIISLIEDPVFLVRSIAAVAATKLESKEGIYKIVQQMSIEKGYAHYYYRDVLLQGSQKVFAWIEEIAELAKNSQIHLAALEVLSGKTFMKQLSFLKRDLESNDAAIRLAAIKLFVRNPQKNCAEVMFNNIDDPKEEIRSEAILGMEYLVGMGFLSAEKGFNKLKKSLTDESWMVRMKAATTLKKMGETGLEILNQQDKKVNTEAFEAAQYALEFS